MCDTIVAGPSVTIDGSVIFAKNSDRQPNEPHEIVHIPSMDTKTEDVQCTYISIPQVNHTAEILLSKPNWIWGAEMGTNEYGVVIGNEAVYTTEEDNKDPKLIGMDLIRLALERGKTAEKALDIITNLLVTYGQGGNCGFEKPEYYDNSFIIADEKEAWVLETAGKFWIAERIDGIRTISNGLTIETEYDKIHPDLLDHAIETGRCKDEDDFNFRKQYKSFFMDWAAMGKARRACTLKILEEKTGKITPETAMNALRSHNRESDKINPRKLSMKSPCLHASSFKTPAQTTGSMVSHIKSSDRHIHWLTGTSAPCISIFKPFVLHGGTYDLPSIPDKFDNSYLWWKHEEIHRLSLRDFSLSNLFMEDFKTLEDKFIDDIYDESYNFDIDIFEYTKKCYQESVELENKTRTRLGKYIKNNDISPSLFHRRYLRMWNKLSEKAGMKPQLNVQK